MAWNPTFIDLIRFRNLNYEALETRIDQQYAAREEFLKRNGLYDNTLEEYMENYRSVFDEDNEEEQNKKTELEKLKNGINLSNSSKEMVEQVLKRLEQLNGKMGQIKFKTTVDNIRERIQTYNNLIVRLPANPDTNKFTLKSKHIWQDWKEFVDRSLAWLVEEGLRERREDETEEQYAKRQRLYVLYEPTSELTSTFQRQEKKFVGFGTDKKEYQFVEHYVDEGTKVPLVDYSYCMEKIDETTYKARQNDDGTYVGDRWDAWQESDFENS